MLFNRLVLVICFLVLTGCAAKQPQIATDSQHRGLAGMLVFTDKCKEDGEITTETKGKLLYEIQQVVNQTQYNKEQVSQYIPMAEQQYSPKHCDQLYAFLERQEQQRQQRLANQVSPYTPPTYGSSRERKKSAYCNDIGGITFCSEY